MNEEDRHLLINGVCAVVGAEAQPERVVAVRDYIESACRLGDAIDSPNNQNKGILVTIAALSFLAALSNVNACSQIYCR
jgi:hypothetical protein